MEFYANFDLKDPLEPPLDEEASVSVSFLQNMRQFTDCYRDELVPGKRTWAWIETNYYKPSKRGTIRFPEPNDKLRVWLKMLDRDIA